MKRVLVIADDLTGAAEIAGIAVRYGLPSQLTRGAIAGFEGGALVLDTDSRQLQPHQAASRFQQIIGTVATKEFDLVYKKTDSALRGPVLAELEELMSMLNRATALLVPQNPSRGRTIKQGEYRIDGMPLHCTDFANDPDHPARSSKALELLGDSTSAHCIAPSTIPAGEGVFIGEASTSSEISHWAGVADNNILCAGGADFFQSILEYQGLKIITPAAHLCDGSKLFICGSASSYGDHLTTLAREQSVPIFEMPYSSSESQGWSTDVAAGLKHRISAIMTICRQRDSTSGAGERLLARLADAAAQVLSKQPVTTVLIEGGATASAICRRMEWHDFEVCGELAPGIVQLCAMGASQQYLVVKPGSYPWPENVWI